MSVSYWQDKTDKKKIQVDVCVVGAGITGLSTAYWLEKENPDLILCLLEKAEVGSGATGRNAGFVTCGSVEHFNRMASKHGLEKAHAIWAFSEKNRELLQAEIIKDKASEVDFLQRGSFSLAAQASEKKELEATAQLMSQVGIAVEELTEAQVIQRLGAQGFVGGIKYLQDAEVNPTALLGLIQKQLRSPVYTYNPVFNVNSEGERPIIKTPQLQVEADIVIYCLNGYAPTLSPYFEDKIYPTRGQILMFAPSPAQLEGPCYANAYLDYFRQLSDGSLLIGGFRQLETDTEKGYSDHTTETIQQALHDFVKKHLPWAANSPVTHRWSGVMGFSQDGEPMLGSLPSDPRVFFCAGYTGHGLGLAFHSARCLVDMIHGRPIPDWLSAKRL